MTYAHPDASSAGAQAATERDIVIDWLVQNLEAKGRGSRKALAAHLGVRVDAISRMTSDKPGRETRDISANELLRMAEFFGKPPPVEVPPETQVPVMGYVGAGAEIEPDFEQVPPEGLSQVELPFPVPPNIIAFEVRGESMMPVYNDGDVILVYREQQRPTTALLGEEVACRTDDGRRFLKRLERGTDPGTVNLASWNARTIESVRLEWIGEIYLILRSGQVKRIAARERALARRHEREHQEMGADELPLSEKRRA